MDDVTFELTANGVTYKIDFSDFDGLEWRDIKRHTGMTPGMLFEAASQLDLEAIAALVWTHRKRTERKLPFDKVLGSLKINNVELRDVDDESGDDGDDPLPEPDSDDG